MEIQVVADSLRPPGGAGVHSILWAIGKFWPTFCWASPRKRSGRRFWDLGAAAFSLKRVREVLLQSWKGRPGWSGHLLTTHSALRFP